MEAKSLVVEPRESKISSSCFGSLDIFCLLPQAPAYRKFGPNQHLNIRSRFVIIIIINNNNNNHHHHHHHRYPQHHQQQCHSHPSLRCISLSLFSIFDAFTRFVTCFARYRIHRPPPPLAATSHHQDDIIAFVMQPGIPT